MAAQWLPRCNCCRRDCGRWHLEHGARSNRLLPAPGLHEPPDTLESSLHGRSQQSSMTSALPPGLGYSACRQLRPLIVESGSPTEASVPVVLRLATERFSRGQ